MSRRYNFKFTDWVTIREAAEFCHVQPKTLKNWIKEGKIESKNVRVLPNGWYIVKLSAIMRPKNRIGKVKINRNGKPAYVGLPPEQDKYE